MKITQEQLNEELKTFTGESINYAKDQKLTYRLLIIEVILSQDKDRSGDDRLKGFALALKIDTQMGVLELEDAEIKLIQTRMDSAVVVTSNDWLYGKLHKLLTSKDATPDGT